MLNTPWRKLRAQAGYSGRFHALRNYHLTWYAKQGATLREVMDRGGHSTPRMALRQLDKQLVSNLSLLGFTPSDRSRLGLVQVNAKSKLEELMERRANRDELLRQHEQEQGNR